MWRSAAAMRMANTYIMVISWESTESIFQKWQNGPRGKPRRPADIHQSGPVPEHQPGSPLVGHAELHGESAAIGARVEARRFAPQTYDAAGNAYRAGT